MDLDQGLTIFQYFEGSKFEFMFGKIYFGKDTTGIKLEKDI